MTATMLDPLAVLEELRTFALSKALNSDDFASVANPKRPGFQLVSPRTPEGTVMHASISDDAEKIVIYSRVGGTFKSQPFDLTTAGKNKALSYISDEILQHRVMGRV